MSSPARQGSRLSQGMYISSFRLGCSQLMSPLGKLGEHLFSNHSRCGLSSRNLEAERNRLQGFREPGTPDVSMLFPQSVKQGYNGNVSRCCQFYLDVVQGASVPRSNEFNIPGARPRGHWATRRQMRLQHRHSARSCGCAAVLPVLDRSRLSTPLLDFHFRWAVFVWLLLPLDRPRFSISANGHVVDIHWTGQLFPFGRVLRSGSPTCMWSSNIVPFTALFCLAPRLQASGAIPKLFPSVCQDVYARTSALPCATERASQDARKGIRRYIHSPVMLFLRLLFHGANSISSYDEEYLIPHSHVQSGIVRITVKCEMVPTLCRNS